MSIGAFVRRVCIGAVVVLAAGPASAGLRESAKDAGWIAGAAAADLWTTELVLAHGGHEANPVMGGSLSRRVTVKVAVVSSGVVLAGHLRKHGHPRGAKWVRWGCVALQAGLAGWNLSQAHR